MRKIAVGIVAAVASFAALAELDTEIHENFDGIHYVIKGTDKYYMRLIQNGWQFTKGPVAFVPGGGWRPGSGKNGVFMSVDCSEDDAKKPHVHSGTGSLRVGVVGGKGSAAILRGAYIKPGKYKLTVWTKGTGKLVFAAYSYFNPGDKRIESRLAGCEIKPSAEWVKTEKVINCGANIEGAKRTTFAFNVVGGDVYVDDLDLVLVQE